MNGLILDNHCARIEDTPFKMCLHIGKPLQICNPILLEMLKHWLPAYESFRVMQWSIPFSCADICMCLALSIIDVDVEFDKNVCEVVDSLMKDKLITIENVIDMIKSVVHSDFDDVDNFKLCVFGTRADGDLPKRVNINFAGGEDVHEEGGVEVEVEVGDHDDEIRHEPPIVVERMNREEVEKAFDLNSKFYVGHCGDVSTLQLLVPYVPKQPSIDALEVDFMKLYKTVTYFDVPYMYY
ncbi:hypothetical protein DEO72_LG11g905 [Vigna unguiculata]|uniref:Uncharacterized protein n=1 Tax=Vigna unguiculata TaxID=3917 RepID=A0A4D6NQ18_VIGUN|nr:hypothetical protein DEO72_LG11g905 [Vigna unguiculata]